MAVLSVDEVYELYLIWHEDETVAQLQRAESEGIRALVHGRTPMSEPVFRGCGLKIVMPHGMHVLQIWKQGTRPVFRRALDECRGGSIR